MLPFGNPLAPKLEGPWKKTAHLFTVHASKRSRIGLSSLCFEGFAAGRCGGKHERRCSMFALAFIFPWESSRNPKKKRFEICVLYNITNPNNALNFLDQSHQITMDHTSSIVSSLHNMDTLIESRPKCSGTFYALKSVAEILKVPSTIPS